MSGRKQGQGYGVLRLHLAAQSHPPCLAARRWRRTLAETVLGDEGNIVLRAVAQAKAIDGRRERGLWLHFPPPSRCAL